MCATTGASEFFLPRPIEATDDPLWLIAFSSVFVNFRQKRLYQIYGGRQWRAIAHGFQFADGVGYKFVEVVARKNALACENMAERQDERGIRASQFVGSFGVHSDNLALTAASPLEALSVMSFVS